MVKYPFLLGKLIILNRMLICVGYHPTESSAADLNIEILRDILSEFQLLEFVENDLIEVCSDAASDARKLAQMLTNNNTICCSHSLM